jgi:hypothetical protein
MSHLVTVGRAKRSTHLLSEISHRALFPKSENLQTGQVYRRRRLVSAGAPCDRHEETVFPAVIVGNRSEPTAVHKQLTEPHATKAMLTVFDLSSRAASTYGMNGRLLPTRIRGKELPGPGGNPHVHHTPTHRSLKDLVPREMLDS